MCVVSAVAMSLGVAGCAGGEDPQQSALAGSVLSGPEIEVQGETVPAIPPDVSSVPSAQPNPVPDKKNIGKAVVADAVRKDSPNAIVGAVVFDVKANKPLHTENADRPFRSASLVKLLIGLDELARSKDSKDRAKVATMLSASDDQIASALWTANGGSAIVLRMVRTIGLTATKPPTDPGQWGNTMLSAQDVVRIYLYLLKQAPQPDRLVILRALGSAPRVAADGFDQHFGIPSGIKRPWAIKQGWSDTDRDIVVHSSGLVGDGWSHIVVLLTQHPRAQRWSVASKSVTSGAQAVSALV